MITDYFNLSIGHLKRKKLRSGLTVLGIFISIATIFILISLSLGLDAAVKEQFRLLGSDKILILPKGQAGAPGSGGAVQLTIKDVDFIQRLPGIKDQSYFTVGNAKVEFDNQARYYMVIGIPLDKSKVFEETGAYSAVDGRMLKSGDVGKVMIGYSYKYGNIFKKTVQPNNKISINGQEFKVTGILKSVGNPSDDSNIYMPMDDFKTLFKSGDRVDEILVQTKQGEDINAVSENIKKRLMNFRKVDDKTIDFTISTPEELLASFGIVLNIITVFLVGVAAISLIVGCIGIANTMYTSVLERTKEIGTMKAIGAKNSDILLIFVGEAGILGFIGGLMGVLLGIGIGKIIDYIAINALGTNLLRTATPLWLILGCWGFAFFIGAISGYLPARQASKIKPADTLRYE
jgi:putative ABC transport system permease protein